MGKLVFDVTLSNRSLETILHCPEPSEIEELRVVFGRVFKGDRGFSTFMLDANTTTGTTSINISDVIKPAGTVLIPGDSIISKNSMFFAVTAVGETTATVYYLGKIDITMNYEDLINKPQVNSVTLIGNKSLADLGIIAAIEAHHDSTKQDVIADLDTIRSGSALGMTAYQKPTTGIPKSDLSASVQASLNLADTALQSASLEPYPTKVEVSSSIGAATASVKQWTSQSLTEYRKASAQDVIDATKASWGTTLSHYGITDAVKSVNHYTPDSSGNVTVRTFMSLPSSMDPYMYGTTAEFCEKLSELVNPEGGSAYLTGASFTDAPLSMRGGNFELIVYVPVSGVYLLEISSTDSFEEFAGGIAGKWMAMYFGGTPAMEWQGLMTCPEQSVSGSYKYVPVHDSDGVSKYWLDTQLATKQGNIPDLATIRSGSALGATALQPAALQPYRTSASQDVIDATKEDKSNKVTALSSSSTDTQYPSAKAVYDVIAENEVIIATALNELSGSKQNVISDLSTIRYGAALGATALQSVPSTYRTAAAQDIVDATKITEPSSDGTSGQVLTTDGSGSRSWTSKTQVIDNVTSTATGSALSAYQGKLLSDRVDNLSTIGRFLAIWNCVTGLPLSEPSTIPYTYRTGDYFRVGQTGSVNYMPSGSQYTGTASTTVDTSTSLGIGAVYYYDGSVWRLQASGGGGRVQDVQVNGASVLSGGIANIDLTPYRTSAAQDIIDQNLSGSIATREAVSNKVTSLSSGSTDTQYPSAKAVYDVIAENELIVATALNSLNETKQDSISDLATIRSGSALGMTALQSSSLQPYRTSASQDVIDATKEDKSNKVTTISSSSTDTQYPSAKAVYNSLVEEEEITAGLFNVLNTSKQDVISDLNTIRSGSALGATALQSASLNPYRVSVAQDIIDATKEDKSNKVTALTSGSTDTQYPSAKATYDAIQSGSTTKEDVANKVTSLTSGSTDTQYPSAKCVYDLVGNVESALATIIGSGSV